MCRWPAQVPGQAGTLTVQQGRAGQGTDGTCSKAKGQSNLSCSSYRLIPFRHQHFGELAFLKAFLIFKDFFRSMFAREEDAYAWND